MKKIFVLIACLFLFSSMSFAVEKTNNKKIDFSQYYSFYTLENYSPQFHKLSKEEYKKLSKEEKKNYKTAKNLNTKIERCYEYEYSLEFYANDYPQHIPLKIKYFYQLFANADIKTALEQLAIIKQTPEYEKYLDKKLYEIMYGYLSLLDGEKKGLEILRKNKANKWLDKIEKDFKNTQIGLEIIGINGTIEQDIIKQKIKSTGNFVKEPNFYEIMTNCPYGDGDYWYQRKKAYKHKLDNCIYNYNGNNFVNCIQQINKDQEQLSNVLLSEIQSRRLTNAFYSINNTLNYHLFRIKY